MIDIHQNMPISLILTPFDHFQIRPTFAVTPNLILESCRIQLFLLNIFQVQKKNTLYQNMDGMVGKILQGVANIQKFRINFI